MLFSIITFGCQMNAGDSEWLARTLRGMGWEEIPPDKAAQADVVVINTCSVRKKPEEKVYSLLGRLRDAMRDNPRAFVAVGGCLAQQVGEEFFRRFPQVRLVFGTDGAAAAPQAIERLAAEPGLRLSLLDFAERYEPRERHWPDEKVASQAFVTIMQGCDNFCAYCIVPHVRGRQKSRPAADVLTECREWLARGATEITLLGQNVNSYGQDASGDGTGFADLLRSVSALPGLRWLRFVTSHPKDIAPEVIRAFAELDNLAPKLHLPVQSGSDRILSLMGRKYDRARYLDIVARLREARPDIALSTDLIVGFPTETEAEFRETLSLMEEARFESSFSFLYNDRPGVRACAIEPKVADAVKTRRLLELQALQERLTEEAYAAWVGREIEVVFERGSRKDGPGESLSLAGRDPYGRVVNVALPTDGVKHEDDLTGQTARVTITMAKKHSLNATLAETPWLR